MTDSCKGIFFLVAILFTFELTATDSFSETEFEDCAEYNYCGADYEDYCQSNEDNELGCSSYEESVLVDSGTFSDTGMTSTTDVSTGTDYDDPTLPTFPPPPPPPLPVPPVGFPVLCECPRITYNGLECGEAIVQNPSASEYCPIATDGTSVSLEESVTCTGSGTSVELSPTNESPVTVTISSPNGETTPQCQDVTAFY